ncbi:MFS transporter [Actinacidiphila oryziradicis]|uniref:MFS transporter n=1 Tax=Actinacidiphila oryziradicis TaxID=2571141 RepID=A0A4U0RRY8_9ACTN|nr:MFS transporter [Actinacidiphila oryziradicis]TJZ98799.1 MFS transporter [Actinacidiphila oryziradicis]
MPSADTGASAVIRAGASIPASQSSKLSPGDPGHRRALLALFAAGMATFVLLYSTQALLPAISAGLALTPAQASLTVSATTAALAVALLPMSALSERYGRTAVMTASVFSSSAIALAIPFAPNLTTLVALRAVQGVALAGLPATAMAYLAEEVHPKAVASAIGIYVAGNSIGGMSGRILTGVIAQAWGWRVALGAVGLMALASAVAFRLLVPAARHFRRGPINPAALWRTVTGHLGNPLLRRLYVIGLLFMSVFGAVYTVLGYRLAAEPFDLSQSALGLIFLVYLVGTAASAASGTLHARLGRRGALYIAVALTTAGLLVTLFNSLTAVIFGLILVTGGFFTGHSVASSAVSRTATTGRAQASALYLTAYYIGSSLGGTVGASAFHSAGWGGTVAVCLAALVGAAGITLYATRRAVAERRVMLAAR